MCERIRKRKAFADSELDSTSRVLPMLHTMHPLAVSTAATAAIAPPATSTSAAVANNHMYPMAVPAYMMKDSHYATNAALSVAKGPSPSSVTSSHQSFEFSNFLRSHLFHSYESNNNVDFIRANNDTHKIRVVDEANLMGYYSTTAAPVAGGDRDITLPQSYSNVAKPRLSFSIESIIGIK